MRTQGLSNNKYFGHYVLIVLVAILAFFQVSMLMNPLKWDLIDQAYPWKYFIGECLQNGYLPLWNPYQLLGYPIHADPQSSAWYPVVWIFGYFFGYDIYAISLDLVLHIAIAGLGMHYLIRSLKIDDRIALIAAISYMLSGFFVGNAQHFMWIISASWIPFVIGIYLKFSYRPEFKHIVILAAVMFMFISGGYPAFILTTAYLVLVIFSFFSIRMSIEKEFKKLRKYIVFNVVGVLLIVLVSWVVLSGISTLSEEMTRGNGVTLTQALFCPFSVESFISFIFPFATVSEIAYYNTDLSMSNAYFGIVLLAILVFSAFTRLKKIIWVFFAFGIFMLGLAVGDSLPLREFAYNYIPFMNLFRFPSLFRIFFILCFIVVASAGLNNILENKDLLKLFRKYFTGLALLIIALTIYYNIISPHSFGSVWQKDVFIFNQEGIIASHIAFQGIITSLLMLVILLILYFSRDLKRTLRLILIVVIIDMGLAAQLNGPYTVYYHQFRSKDVKEFSYFFQPGFPVPDNSIPVSSVHDHAGISYGPLWRNLNIFHKNIAYDGYNPLHLKGFEYLHDSLPDLFRSSISAPPVHFSDTLSGSSDTIIITGFTPNSIKLETHSLKERKLVYLQNYYPGWKAYLNKDEAKIDIHNHAFISMTLPPGKNEVFFEYDPGDVKTGFCISFISLVLLCVAGVLLELYDRNNIRRIIR